MLLSRVGGLSSQPCGAVAFNLVTMLRMELNGAGSWATAHRCRYRARGIKVRGTPATAAVAADSRRSLAASYSAGEVYHMAKVWQVASADCFR